MKSVARTTTRLLAAGLVVSALACASPTSLAGTSAPSTQAEPPGPISVWLAVYDAAADPQDLSAEREQMLSGLGDALEGSVVVSPAGCFEGLPKGVDGYVLALQQTERVYVRALAEQLDGHPRFLAEVTVTCTD